MLLGAGVLGLSGCGVYVPHVAPMPVMTQRVEAKLAVTPLLALGSGSGGGTRLNVPTVEGYVAVSPVRHLVVVAAGGGSTIRRRPTTLRYGVRERQGDVSAGYYGWLNANRTYYLATTAGLGAGSATRYFTQREARLFTAGGTYQYLMLADYRRVFAQAQVSQVTPTATVSGFLRFDRVQFQVLEKWRAPIGNPYFYQASNYAGSYYALPPPTVTYASLGWSLRVGKGTWQLMAESVWSTALGRPQKAYNTNAPLPYNASLLTLGVVWRPGYAPPAVPGATP